jgi:ABC-type nitrate/sulfonate/bicarbonate transport system substrate-binding protein
MYLCWLDINIFCDIFDAPVCDLMVQQHFVHHTSAQRSTSSEFPRQQHGNTMEHFTLQLDWQPNAQFAGVIMAQELGWYRDAGINLNIVPWTPHTNQMDALANDGNNGANVLVSTEDNLHIIARAQGKPVIAIGAMIQFSGIGWMTLESADIRSIRDLKGKRIGIHGDGITALHVTLRQHGLNEADVEIVDVGFNYDELLSSGEYDAIQCFVIVEPRELAQKGFKLHSLPAYAWGYRVYSQVISTTERMLARQRPALERLLKATFDGWRYAIAHPDEAAQMIVSRYLPDANAEAQAGMLADMTPHLIGDVGIERLGWMQAERWDKSIGYLADAGIIPARINTEEVMTNDLMASIYNIAP